MSPLSRRLRWLSPAFLMFAVSCSRTELPPSETAQAEPISEVGSPGHSHGKKADGHVHTSAVEHKADHQSQHDHHGAVSGDQHHEASGHHQGQSRATHHENDSAPVEDATSLAIFEKRILPIFQSPKPSSCSERHLSGVDLKEYIRPTQLETFASLVAADLIDTEKPDDLKILQFISRRPKQPSLVAEKVRQQEYEAFRAWIRAAVNDPTLLAGKGDAEPVGPELPVEIVRHARKDRVLASFVENV